MSKNNYFEIAKRSYLPIVIAVVMVIYFLPLTNEKPSKLKESVTYHSIHEQVIVNRATIDIFSQPESSRLNDQEVMEAQNMFSVNIGVPGYEVTRRFSVTTSEIENRQLPAQEISESSLTEKMQNTFDSENQDSTWEASVRETIPQLIANVADANISEIICSTSICRVIIYAAPELSKRNSVESISNNIDWQGEQYFDLSEDDIIVAYLGRPGINLPR